jgi:protein-disulfide isomerase
MSKKSDRSVRAEAARQVLEAERARRRRTIAIQVGVVVLVVAAVVGGTVIALQGSDDAPTAAPPGLTADGGYVVGDPDAAVTVEVVEDFQCPACQSFEAAAGDYLDELAATDGVNVEYRGIAFLDRASSTEYASRALNASACVIEAADVDVWKEFHRQLFLQQPAEGGAGLPDSDLVSIAEDAGAEGVESCIRDRTYDEWVDATTEEAFDNGVSGTPTVFVNGEVVEQASPATIQAAVDEALAS